VRASVQSVCDLLVQGLQKELGAITSGTEPLAEDLLRSAEDTDYLQDTIDKLTSYLNSADSGQDSLVGILEANAFLAATQKAHNKQATSRISKWAGIYSDKLDKSSDEGALNQLLRNIGIKVDDEYVTRILGDVI